ncbi:hypothetical protein ACWD00_25440 [Streptomyces viridiviolaceus]
MGHRSDRALVMYSCAHIGMALGLLPQRKLFKDVLERRRRDEATEPVGLPRRHQVFLVRLPVGVLPTGFVLTR